MQALRPKIAADDCYFGCCGKAAPVQPASQTLPQALPKAQTAGQATSQTAAVATMGKAAGGSTALSAKIEQAAQALPASQKLPAEDLPASQTLSTMQVCGGTICRSA